MTCCTLFAELRGQDMRVNYHESSDCIAQKITCQIFPHKKHLGIENFSPPPPPPQEKKKKTFNHPRHLKSGVTPSPPGSSINTIQK